MFNKETTETNRETAKEKNNLARDGLRVQLTENKDSCKKICDLISLQNVTEVLEYQTDQARTR